MLPVTILSVVPRKWSATMRQRKKDSALALTTTVECVYIWLKVGTSETELTRRRLLYYPENLIYWRCANIDDGCVRISFCLRFSIPISHNRESREGTRSVIYRIPRGLWHRGTCLPVFIEARFKWKEEPDRLSLATHLMRRGGQLTLLFGETHICRVYRYTQWTKPGLSRLTDKMLNWIRTQIQWKRIMYYLCVVRFVIVAATAAAVATRIFS